MRKPRQMNMFDEIVVDNFAGGGGASIGIEQALGRPVDIAINHDGEAIAMHEANHPFTKHYQNNVWSVDPLEATGGRPVGLLWSSPDCKHFSKAKGGQPKSKEIRDLAWVTLKWAALVHPRIIILENVEEFITWGPLLPNGLPCQKNKGRTFQVFVNALRRLGYEVEWKNLRACDYGAPTIRKRLFLIARCDGQPIVWPAATHGDPAKKIKGLKKWRVAAECIDWSIPCPSIFDRKKPLADNTLRRIAKGIQKFVIDAKKPFIVCCNHGGNNGTRDIHQPAWTVTAAHDAVGVVVPTLIQTGQGERVGQAPRVPGLDKPLGTCVAGGVKHALIGARLSHFRDAPGGVVREQKLDEPLSTITSGGVCHSLEVATLMKNFAGNYTGAGVDLNEPLHTVTAKDHHSIVGISLDRQFGNSEGATVNEPIGAITADGAGKTALVASTLVRQFGTSNGSDINEPMKTVMCDGGGGKTALVQAFLAKYYSKGGIQAINEPVHTVTAKDRLGVVTIESVDYVISDIGMRMLQPRELFLAQGFPEDYIIAPVVNGKALSKSAQVRMCGNSVSPPVARALVAANYNASRKEVSA